MGVSKRTLLLWEQNGKFVPQKDNKGNKFFNTDDLKEVPEIKEMIDSSWNEELKIKHLRRYTSIEHFAGGISSWHGKGRILPFNAK